jgi:Raf kinase inhibitor-like YbhB/YbcL family protein
MRRRRVGLVALAGLAASLTPLAGCGGSGQTTVAPSPSAPIRIRLHSPEFKNRRLLPRSITCKGAGTSPGLDWSGTPRDARSLALVVLDRNAPGGRFAHWTLWNLDPRLTRIEAGQAPKDAVDGKNGFGKIGWGPPCPPKGNPPHDYEFTLYSLKRPLDLKRGAAVNSVLGAIARSAISRGTLTGYYSR